jgi:hypothetical protein
MTNLTTTIDALGAVKAQIADLKALEDQLAAEIKTLGAGAYEGDLFRVAISEIADSVSLDPKAAEAKLRELGVDGRWFSKNQKIRKGSLTLRVSARKGA